jgi:hypothetical protein
MKQKPDLLEAKHWIYPINRPKRDYQFNIVKNCLFDNTLVALPTGLGKTFVAGVVMLNCRSHNRCSNAILTSTPLRLPVVSRRENCVCCTDKTFGCAADHGIARNLRNTWKRCHGIDRPGSERYAK